MKYMMVVAKRSRKNKNQLAIQNLLDKTTITKVSKVSSVIKFNNKYSWAISNIELDIARDLK